MKSSQNLVSIDIEVMESVTGGTPWEGVAFAPDKSADQIAWEQQVERDNIQASNANLANGPSWFTQQPAVQDLIRARGR
jgi:hypothetical protein